ncbi:ABC transporter ATP-binding protein [Leifsonia sp. F6_8S_P_1B]|uniref:ABC transporter ATP-binding protein n=1 Tax=Leifsonia williamsii TaxID=3035919 RepID=A0ABT8K8Q1_9MICO|nr:ABC transporter ATP-binding protein [Leifsonia williamsii]MDN4613363.1 ABC transporter ATP-binding protein [Leifsonia williamsii]
MSGVRAAHPPARPSEKHLSSVPRFLLWQAARQPATLTAGVLFGVVWMLCQAVWPYLLGRAVDEGVGGDSARLWLWCGALLVVAVIQALAGMLRHRMAVSNWLRSSLGIARLIGHHSAETGPAITATTSSGEIVATVNTDSLRLGAMFDVTARLGGGIVAFVVVSIIMLNSSVPLGLAVVIGVPLVAAVLALLLRPLRTKQAVWREESGRLTTLGADTVVGLRVLRGVGGEHEFVDRYARQSQRVRGAGVGVATTQSWLDGLQVLLPGAFLVFIVWFGAHLAVDGAITPGQLTAFYGYATFLVLPLRTAVEAAQTFTAGVVSARRVLSVLRTRPAARDRGEVADAPPLGSAIEDVASGVLIRPGVFTAIVDADPDEAAAIATRLGRFDDAVHREAPVLWGGVDTTRVPVREVRERIVVNDANPHLFGGRLLDGLDVQPTRSEAGARASDWTDTSTGRIRRVSAALEAAAATETVDALPSGVHERVAERGRTFSGGQRQRLSLARALLTDAEVLVLIEPTSAVDAHTESQIAERLREARDGRTTVVVTASPLLLDRMDTIAVVRRGRVLGTGTHQELLRQEDDLGELYRAIVSRTISAAEPADGEDLDAAWTGSIDALWTATHPVQAQKAGTKANKPAKAKKPAKAEKPGKQKKTTKNKRTKGDGDAASDR